jgi:riboflavin biosynthesis pyrimidine reductase
MARVVDTLAGKVVVAEGGPTLAGVMVALGLVDEFFVTIAPRVVSGGSARVVHGPDADPEVWRLEHGFVDDEGFLFLRYARR